VARFESVDVDVVVQVSGKTGEMSICNTRQEAISVVVLGVLDKIDRWRAKVVIHACQIYSPKTRSSGESASPLI
jgi:hypothetical protein